MIEAIEALKNSGKVIVDEDHDWGYQLRFVNEAEYCGKFLVLENSSWGSLHFHHKKKETFVVLYGILSIIHEEYGVEYLNRGEQYTFEPHVAHKMRKANDHTYFGNRDVCIVLEVSTHDDDSDTYRIGGDDK